MSKKNLKQLNLFEMQGKKHSNKDDEEMDDLNQEVLQM